MITIKKKHIAYALIALFVALPFILGQFSSKPFHPWTNLLGSTINSFVEGWAMFYLVAILVGGSICTLLGFGIGISALFDKGWETAFTIKIPKLSRNSTDYIAKDMKEDLLKLGTLDQHSEEWQKIYERLNKKGQWG